MKCSTLVAAASLAGSAIAQKVVAYTEPGSNIKFTSFSRGAFNWGISLPPTPNGDFIGHLVRRHPYQLGVM